MISIKIKKEEISLKFKKIVALTLAGAMAFSMAACSGNGSSDSGKKEGGGSSDEALSVSIWDTYQEPGIQEILDDFTEETGIKTKMTVVKWDEYWTMLEAGAQGGGTSRCVLDALQRK